MNARLENSISRIAEQARGRYFDLIDAARRSTEQAAGVVRKGKAPLKAVADLGLKMTAISHKTADKVLKLQVKVVSGQIDAVASGLTSAAAANDVRELVGSQLQRVRDGVASVATGAQDTLKIYAGASQELRSVMADTVSEIRDGRKPRKTSAKAPAKATRKSAKKAAKKSATKKSPAAKARAESKDTAAAKAA